MGRGGKECGSSDELASKVAYNHFKITELLPISEILLLGSRRIKLALAKHISKLLNYILKKPRSECEHLRAISMEQSKSVVVIILEPASPPLSTTLSESQTHTSPRILRRTPRDPRSRRTDKNWLSIRTRLVHSVCS
jgi:hypothetical protein